ncbi:MAG: fimbrial protein [Stenotrophomonas indicatrix]|uniref:fimbrial protein n=1 Tax=Stenotrophomonas indicatrix TaxID=2045451 RepID=UPI00372E70F9
MSNKLSVAILSLLAAAVAPSAMAEKLEITGELMTSTCAVQSTGGTITVAMGKVDLKSVNANTRAGQKNFSIGLDCSGSGAEQEVGVRFGGTPHGSTGNLGLTATSTADNVGVALYDASGNHQKIGEDPTQWVIIPADGSGQLDYSAWYASPGQDAIAGTANASGDFVVLYK